MVTGSGVYELSGDVERFSSLVFVGDKDAKLTLGVGDARRLAAEWPTRLQVEPAWKWLSKKERTAAPKDVGDVSDLNGLVVVSEAARAVMSRVGYADDVEYLPVALGGEDQRYVVNVLRVEDVLDVERSRLTLFSSGRIMSVEKFALRNIHVLDGAGLFRIAGYSRAHIYMVAALHHELVRSGMRGLESSPIWP